MNGRATQLKFMCRRMWHYASHYHYGSQSIVLANENAELAGRSQ